ncbi:MAG: hypothetical protein QOG06_533 [Gaiellaceae bacterium]|nr:hypothetical protein [Gaiellaceae bacterium]
MDLYQWLLVFHVTGAFLLLGGGAIAAALSLAALGRERPSEIVLLYGLIRIAVVAIMAGTALAFVFGLWLVHEAGYGYGDGWVVAAIVLLIVANAMGGIGGKRDEQTAKLARELAASGDAPSPELRARVRDPISLALSYGSGLVLIAVLALMIWKPGA